MACSSDDAVTETSEDASFAREIRRRLTGGFLWNLVGAVFNQGSTLAVNIVVSNLSGPVVFGEYAAVQTTIATGAAIASFGTGYTATKYMAELRYADPDRAGRVLGLCAIVAFATGSLMTLLLLGGASWVATHALHAPQLASLLRIASGAAFFNVINWFLLGALSGMEGYRPAARAGAIGGAAYLLVCSAGAWFGGLAGALAGVVASAALQALVLAAALRDECQRAGIRLRWDGLRQERKVLWRFALPSALPGFTTMPSVWIASLVLLREPDGFSQMAFFTAANSFRTITLFLPGVLGTVSMAVLNSQVRLRERTRYWAVFRTSLAATCALSLGAALVLALSGRFLLRLYGPDYGPAYRVLLVLLTAAVLEALWSAVAQIASSRERMWPLLMGASIPRDVLLVVLAWILVPRFQAIGLSLAYGLAWLAALTFVTALAYSTRAPDPSPDVSI
jgi:O-antigen/teichoic acid export membrane protein